MICFCFLFYSDSYETRYLIIYLTDLHRIFRVGRNRTVDYRSEISFSIFVKGRCHGNQFLLVLSTDAGAKGPGSNRSRDAVG